MNHRLGHRLLLTGLFSLALVLSGAGRVHAEARLLLDAATGKVLFAENATQPWYPASVTKLMTTYTTLRAIKEGRIGFNTLITVTRDAAAQQPTKMGFKVGTRLTIDNALKMMLVKSANDIAVAIAEGVGGSIPKFADMMNANAHRLDMTESHFVNPNGLPAENHVTSARDLGILALALIHQFPQDDFYWHIHSIRYGDRIIKNYNTLLARYPGADGMKTGFICASGFNIVASATRNGHRLIAIVLGAYSSRSRTLQAAELLQMGFNNGGLAWLMPSLGSVYKMAPINAQPPDLRDEVCGGHRHTIPLEGGTVAKDTNSQTPAFTLASLKATADKFVLGPPVDTTPPVIVFTGPPSHPDPIQDQSPHRRHSVEHRHHKKKISTAKK